MDNTVAIALQPIPLSVVLADYAKLFKLRVNFLVVLTSWCGAYLATGHFSFQALVHVVFGVGSVAAGTAALNEVFERDLDRQMLRTARRPLVTGHVPSSLAMSAGVALVIGGVLYLAFVANVLTGALALLTTIVYLFVYTPWKTYGPACTAVGAIPGVTPVVLGWTSAGGRDGFACSFAFLYPRPLAVSALSCHRSPLSGRLPASGYPNVSGSGWKRVCDTDSLVFSPLSCCQHHSVRFASQWHRLRRLRRHSRNLVVFARDPTLPRVVRFERSKSCPEPRFAESDNYLPATSSRRTGG
jgi:hypothetical protein